MRSFAFAHHLARLALALTAARSARADSGPRTLRASRRDITRRLALAGGALPSHVTLLCVVPACMFDSTQML